jgi:low affinity Fe/Cu permease
MATLAEKAERSIGAIHSRRASGFARAARRVAAWAGHPLGFSLAAAIVVGWALLGPIFGFSDSWQLVINTGTTIGTFLLVFVLQNTQIRDTKALNLKLDELLRAIDGARTGMVNVEKLPDEELDRLCHELERLGRIAGVPAIEATTDSAVAAINATTERAKAAVQSAIPETSDAR